MDNKKKIYNLIDRREITESTNHIIVKYTDEEITINKNQIVSIKPIMIMHDSTKEFGNWNHNYERAYEIDMSNGKTYLTRENILREAVFYE